MSLLSWIKQTLRGAPDASAAEPPPRHERREAGRERHQETGEPAWGKETGSMTRRAWGCAILTRRRRSWAASDAATIAQRDGAQTSAAPSLGGLGTGTRSTTLRPVLVDTGSRRAQLGRLVVPGRGP